MTLQGERISLRAVEPEDIKVMYCWENDPTTWASDSTHEPLSRHSLEQFVAGQKYDVFQTRQLRLMIDLRGANRTIGCVDLFEIDALNARAGVGILIYPAQDRRQGYATEVIEVLCRYAKEALKMQQLWCEVDVENQASQRLFERAGFELRGTKKAWVWTCTGYHDVGFLQKIL